MTPPRVALLVIGDGRDDLKQDTMRSWNAQSRDYELATIIEVDDRYHTRGFCGAIQDGWELLRAARRVEPFGYVFHLEEDWRFDRPFSIREMADVLDADRSLAQVALRRGPENDVEEAAGGLVNVWPDEYVDCAVVMPGPAGEGAIAYLRHRLFFTTNPCLYSADLIEHYAWPDEPRCEQGFGLTMLSEGLAFAYLGSRLDEPLVTHTGRHQRRGRGY